MLEVPQTGRYMISVTWYVYKIYTSQWRRKMPKSGGWVGGGGGGGGTETRDLSTFGKEPI